ncbi:caspase-1-like [Penaeus chinensis]|uniref:caspase-1-like n=1 Tax=Penaeus chinensis TaxID=139456 RepID=UPI001FB59670|nr:caspase-1-like [Penaeus chinensis]XP_047488438.1 caspase-1-like [Penaeus chinensis]XP_047488439.1 caspase-1-like [Penaeus chinensis]XP_047488441.1 caspase-1-like [Penaeus chinensis]
MVLPAMDYLSFQYDMNHRHRGHCVIFCQEHFDASLSISSRTNSSRDVDMMMTVFKDLGFIVRAHIDLKLEEIKDVLEDLAFNTDHIDCDALVIVFMSTGDQDILYAKDKSFGPQMLFECFHGDRCESLVGKPKLFFIQGDRGDALETGVQLHEKRILRTKQEAGTISSKHVGAESPWGGLPLGRKSSTKEKELQLSALADFLICWSTIDGYCSWRNTNTGSWFIQALAHVLPRDCYRDDMYSMIVSVTRHMMNFSSYSPSSLELNSKKQTPQYTSTLVKKLYLHPKPAYPEIEVAVE